MLPLVLENIFDCSSLWLYAAAICCISAHTVSQEFLNTGTHCLSEEPDRKKEKVNQECCNLCGSIDNYRYKDSLSVHIHHKIMVALFYKPVFDSSIQKRTLLDAHSSQVKLSRSKKKKSITDNRRHAEICRYFITILSMQIIQYVHQLLISIQYLQYFAHISSFIYVLEEMSKVIPNCWVRNNMQLQGCTFYQVRIWYPPVQHCTNCK